MRGLGESAMPKEYLSTAAETERAYLVGAEVKGTHHPWNLEDSVAELGRLADTAGLVVVGQTLQRLEQINAGTFIGKGKVEDLALLAQELNVDVFVFDDELTPAQLRNLERELKVKVLDRTALILDIFAHHAQTREGALQVELAQYEYRLPRLTKAFTNLAQQTGGGAARGGAAGVGLRGPGETKLETDRRLVRHRISQLKKELEQVRGHREQYRRHRRIQGIPVVSLVGYTNAGKSTLLNALTGAGVLATDRLFATLDPVTRRLPLPGGKEALITDTVGFIQKLPTQLVAAFRATLEEITEADLILHVVDITHPNAAQQAQTVEAVLSEIGASDKPVLLALNKVDLLHDTGKSHELVISRPNAVAISALRSRGIEQLLFRIESALADQMVAVRVRIPYSASELIAHVHRVGVVAEERAGAKGVLLEGRVPPGLMSRLEPYID